MSAPATIQVPAADDVEARRKGIGGSDVGNIVGLGRWGTPFSVYAEKADGIRKEVDEESAYLGKALEPVIIEAAARKLGTKIVQVPFLRDEAHPWRVGHPDGEVEDGTAGVEAKTAIVGRHDFREWGDEGTDEIPSYYLPQCHWYLGLRPQWQRVYVPALLPVRGLAIFVVERDDEFIAWLQEQADAFWHNHVEKRIPPEIDGSEVAKKWLAAKFKRETQPLLDSTASLDSLALAYRREAEAAAKHDAAAVALQNRIKQVIGEAEGIKGGWGRLTWKATKKGTRVFRASWNEEANEGSTTEAA